MYSPLATISDNPPRQFFIYIGLLLIGMLSGCAALAPARPIPIHTYLLLPPKLPLQVKTASARTHLTLLISMPQAVAGYNTRQMAYTRKPYALSYFSRNEWIDTPGRMLEPILIGALEASGHFKSVIPSRVRIPADLRLDTEITLLVQDFSTQPSQGHFILDARLINLVSGQEITHQTLSAREPMSAENPYNGVIALNRALEHILEELVIFCTQATLKR